ncbi:Immunity protein 49 [Amycolatopsis pretoriensis]|uniref:Immunity protein 49 n=1 Tax=Amycolatopsis pretoriensis TaxID=218821 RepID=A0A1H5QPF1_9PSEU|nr:immunity 49 family protein [Amycolatopsis pretoriensis]SEF27201.1 Immunity protein 49 [Amycolatopsis pretoriensis]
MRTVARHEIDEKYAAETVEMLAERLHEAREDIEEEVLGPGFALKRSLEEFRTRTVGDPRAAWNDTWLAFARAMQAGDALFVTAARPAGEQVEFRFGEDTVRRPATGPTRDSHAANWLTAFYLAIVCRERPRIDRLAAVPAEVFRDSGADFDDFLTDWAQALRIWARGEDGLVDAVLTAMSGTEPESLRVFPPEPVLKQQFPPMELFYLFTQREEAKFNDSLVLALDLHKQYWTADEDRQRNPEGFVALAPLAMACLARDAGMAIDVESDYLPHHLLAGTRVGEITI